MRQSYPTNNLGVSEGLKAGVISGLVTIYISMQESFIAHQGVFFPQKLIAATLLGPKALEGGAFVIAMGLGIHVVIAALLGGFFGSMIQGVNKLIESLIYGLGYGLVIWAVMSVIILPWVNPVLAERVAEWRLWWIFNHLVYGGMLFLTPLLRPVEGRAAEETQGQGGFKNDVMRHTG